MKRFGKKLLSPELVDVSTCIVLLLTRDAYPQGWCPSQPAPFRSHTFQQECRHLWGKRELHRDDLFSVFSCLVPNPGLGYWLGLVFHAEWPFVIILKSFPADRNLERWSEFDTFLLSWQLISLPHNVYKRFSNSEKLWHKIFFNGFHCCDEWGLFSHIITHMSPEKPVFPCQLRQ